MNLIDKDKLMEYLEDISPKSNLTERVRRGDFDYLDYQRATKLLLGQKIKNFYCNGYFGRDFELENATITGIWIDHSFDSEDTLVIEIEKTSRVRLYAYIEGDNKWKEAYECLTEWIEDSGYE